MQQPAVVLICSEALPVPVQDTNRFFLTAVLFSEPIVVYFPVFTKTICFMKKSILCLAFALCSLLSFAQTKPDYTSFKLDKKEDYTEAVTDAAAQAANTILSLPLQKDNPERAAALQFLLRWMSGTPDFQFVIDETATKLSKGNDDLFGVYLAAMCQYSLQNRDAAKDAKTVKLNTVKAVLAYCKSQNLKLTGELKKLDKANEAGELEKKL